MNNAFMGALGILLAVAAQIVAWLLAGLGHGWGAPFAWSLPLFLLYPVALLRLQGTGEGRASWSDIAFLALALGLDLSLAAETYWREATYFRMMWQISPSWVIIWLLLWFGWQALIVATLLLHLDPPETDFEDQNV